MSAECLACSSGVDVEVYCMDNPTTAGCEGMFTIINNNYLIKQRIICLKNCTLFCFIT